MGSGTRARHMHVNVSRRRRARLGLSRVSVTLRVLLSVSLLSCCDDAHRTPDQDPHQRLRNFVRLLATRSIHTPMNVRTILSAVIVLRESVEHPRARRCLCALL